MNLDNELEMAGVVPQGGGYVPLTHDGAMVEHVDETVDTQDVEAGHFSVDGYPNDDANANDDSSGAQNSATMEIDSTIADDLSKKTDAALVPPESATSIGETPLPQSPTVVEPLANMSSYISGSSPYPVAFSSNSDQPAGTSAANQIAETTQNAASVPFSPTISYASDMDDMDDFDIGPQNGNPASSEGNGSTFEGKGFEQSGTNVDPDDKATKLLQPIFVTSEPYGFSPYPNLVGPTTFTNVPSANDGHVFAAGRLSTNDMASASFTDISSVDATTYHQVSRPQQTDDSDNRGKDKIDLLPRMQGMFRLLDLYSEIGSGGLVDKIVIDQDSLRSFIDTVLPGAYKSVTKIDFAALDDILIKPIGVYGSKSEIVRFLFEAGAINDELAALLSVPEDPSSQTQARLRSGIYILIPSSSAQPAFKALESALYVVYWPEDTTWDDSAIGGVRKNRVTFIRYLTRLTDQIRVLMSPEHASSLVWKDVVDVDDDDAFGYGLAPEGRGDDDDDTVDDRFFKFEVAKTNEQEEGVAISEGFTVQHMGIEATDVSIALRDGSTVQKRLNPSFLVGETGQGFVAMKFVQSETKKKFIDGTYTYVFLRSELKRFPTIFLAEDVDEEALHILLDQGDLKTRVPGLQEKYRIDKSAAEGRRARDEREALAKALGEIKANAERLRFEVRLYLHRRVSDLYPMLDIPSLHYQSTSQSQSIGDADPLGYFHHVRATYREADVACNVLMAQTKFQTIKFTKYTALKERFLVVRGILHEKRDLTDDQREQLIGDILSTTDAAPVANAPQGVWGFRIRGFAKSVLSKIGLTIEAADNPSYAHHLSMPSDPDFLASLVRVGSEEPMYADAIAELRDLALASLGRGIEKIGDIMAGKMETAQENEVKSQAYGIARSRISIEKRDAFYRFRHEVQTALGRPSKHSPLTIYSVKRTSQWNRYGEFDVKGFYEEKSESRIERRIWALELTEDDRQRMKDESRFVPSPRISRQTGAPFQFPPQWRVKHVQLLGPRNVLLIADTPRGVGIWLFPLHSAISAERPTKHLPSFPGKYVVAVDEQKRVLAFTGVLNEKSPCTVQLLSLDETFSNLHSRGTPFNLAPWYQDGDPNIVASSFFSGTEELCLVESSGRIRVFSFISQTFRPATVHVPTQLIYVQSSPDGGALVVIEGPPTGRKSLRVFHQASFGVNDGLVNPLPLQFDNATSFSVTSLGQRGNVFLTAFVPSIHSIVSASVDISKKATEYLFRAKDESSKSTAATPTQHNCFIDCFSDVWARYPVVAAIQRETISPSSRLPASVTFVSDFSGRLFDTYFKQMIRDFERLSRKPTDQRLDKIRIGAAPFNDLEWRSPSSSQFKSGEWLAELLCLIPIHIAVARENRFVPLKDGIFDPALEQRLLGADVSRIIDSITLGWYESIFSSYMASKPVKVISSMGEQSVGKSYSLNHIVDSSFAGSAVRTTEGVWLSVCPTRDMLVVALDFEGVHSIERTAQEDMLLVLFNTALSNLVLFRNNFALSRDVANMFTSFQASTHLFDPASNPKLFKGLLAIVIKDVVDGDKKEIVKEFSSKFHQIVSTEQANNFISMLHDSQLTVIPWSVIQSREFYTLFTKLSKLLYRQRPTHGSAGEFLITIKTLMAKMKAQDWGSIDQTAIKHRATSLMALLPSAFTSGRSGEGLAAEDLKNLDNQDGIPNSDTVAQLYSGKDEFELQTSLASHIAAWKARAAKYDPADLQAHLQTLAEFRIRHVKDWLDANIARFPADNADIRALKRVFDDSSEALRSNLQLCLAECTSCRLRCSLHRSHHQLDHDCGTSHQCEDACDFSDEHEDTETCGLGAGHAGRHICDGSAHLCGDFCHLQGKKGCQRRCTLPVGHMEDEHVCSARTHQCGTPCDARDMPTLGGQLYSCANVCSLPYDDIHARHSCENRMSCPIKCELCQRYCAMGDHFHGMDADALHLCGQDHPCGRQCGAQGYCEVNPIPRSVETIFTGRHATFQYTKYTQVPKRLPCAVVVPAGERQHDGPHTHSTEVDVFHYCEESCINCGYICTLPLGHPQVEHDTRHGSMERTAWAIEGNVDATVEVQGRTFGAQDDGAPQLCSAVCRDLGRHAHIDYCRNAKGGSACQEPESEHIDVPMLPNSHRPKDWVSHKIFWARTGFSDPYSRDEQAEFALCDVQCAGPEHQGSATAPAHPSFCTLPIFHPPQPINWQLGGNTSYVSTDGHSFTCPNPNSLRQAYHVIFVLDKSSSMGIPDRRPVPNQPSTPLITGFNDNRFGAVLSAVHGFWLSRASGTSGARRDSYSVITFDRQPQTRFVNDFTSTPDALLNRIVQVRPDRATHFDRALKAAESVMDSNWSTDRAPVVIFLSDGECPLSDNIVFDICNRAVARGKPLSFHSVLFGQTAYSTSLRRMVTIAEQVAQGAPRDPLSPLVPCAFAEAMDSIRLAETFLTIADSLKKPRASLIRS